MLFREIDDIILEYVVNIVEDVASSSIDAGSDAFDVAEFCEMLSAYLPQTADIAPEKVADWMFELAAEMRELERAKGSALCLSMLPYWTQLAVNETCSYP